MIHVLSERSIIQKDQQSHMADFHMGIYQTMFDQITDKLEIFTILSVKSHSLC